MTRNPAGFCRPELETEDRRYYDMSMCVAWGGGHDKKGAEGPAGWTERTKWLREAAAHVAVRTMPQVRLP